MIPVGRAVQPGLYTGLVPVYEFTKDVRFLQTARLIADYYIENTPDHGIPPNDWDEKNPPYPYESSAAAIAASGMFNLSKLVSEPAASLTIVSIRSKFSIR